VESDHPDLERIRRLAAELAATDPGPGAALAAELAEALAGLSGRVDALWQVISAVVTSAGLGGPAETTRPERSGAELEQADLAQTQLAQTQPGQTQPAHSDLTQAVSAQADFARAMASARRTGQRGLRLSIDGTEWVAALSQQAPGQPRLSQQAPGQPPLSQQAPGQPPLSQQAPDRQSPDRPSPSQPQLPADTDRAAWSVIERLARESSGQVGAPDGDENPRHDDR
jgi:hypothetical protein